MQVSESKEVVRICCSYFLLQGGSKSDCLVGNIVFGAYTGEREVDWALVMRNTVRRLLTKIGKSKPTPIYLYLLDLYIAHKVVFSEDKKIYMAEESFMLHDIEPEDDNQPASSEDSEYESLSSKEIQKLQG